MIERIKEIISKKSILAIDMSDFGDMEKIVSHKNVNLSDLKDFSLHYSDYEILDVNKVIIFIDTNYSMTLDETSFIIDKIREQYIEDINIFYGHSNTNKKSRITIDIFNLSE